MSMFTPAGVGGGRGRGRAVVRRVLAVVLVLLIVAAVVGVAWQFAQREPSDEVSSRPKASCPEPEAAASEKAPIPVVPPEKVKVNVYNATSRGGLASDTAKALKRRGFRIGKVANDPTKRKVTGEAEVRTARREQQRPERSAHK